MKQQNNKLVFPKRMDVWQEYRDAISKESIRSSSWFNDDRKIKSYINDINNVDKNILSKFDFLRNLQLAEISLIDEDNSKSLEQSYKMLKFNLPNLNENFLNVIDEDIEKTESIKKSWHFIDVETKDLNLEKIGNYYNDKNKFRDKIQKSINDNEYKIQMFPQVANEKLKKLHNAIDKSKSIEEWRFIELLKQRVDDTFDFKIVFYIFAIALGVCAIVAIICVILFLVL